ncbi:Triosephosphate isomerase [Entophlyctis helioformis]|nr:Triosephosphate isomerase [Entophlyctis helioformis]
MPRTFLIGGNWKMNGDRALVDTISNTLNNATLPEGVEVVVAPPFTLLSLAREKFKGSIGVSAQNASFEKSGAFTGEISCAMLKDIAIDWVILGHSERREIYGESDETVGKKVAFAVKNGFKVIACCGEKLEHREANKTTEVVFRQLEGIRAQLTPAEWANIVIAYEPVWAIGTGKVATPEQAQEVHEQIRAWLSEHVSADVASATRILYGGSVNGANSSSLQSKPDIDGFLVGGASLKADDFLTICKSKM